MSKNDSSTEKVMKGAVKPTRKRPAKRDLFAELKEGMDALADARHGKRTLKTTRTHLRLK